MSDFKAKMHQNPKFGCGSAPHPIGGGAYSAPPHPLAGFKEPTSKGRGGDGTGRDGRDGMGGEGRGWQASVAESKKSLK